MEFLLAPTVPSEPSPQNTARVTFSGSMSKSASKGQAGMRQVIIDTYRKMIFRALIIQLIKDTFNHGWRKFF